MKVTQKAWSCVNIYVAESSQGAKADWPEHNFIAVVIKHTKPYGDESSYTQQ